MDAISQLITWQEIKGFTANIAKDRVVGRGKYGRIYKGVTANGEEFTLECIHHNILLRKGPLHKKLVTELHNLMLLRHPNLLRLILPFISYSTLTDICYEYLPNATSLQQYLSGKSKELDWQTCYRIIKGTCDGLAYLHAGLEEPIYHLDLTPICILLDKNMEPKLQYVSFSKFIYLFTPGIADRPYHGTPGYRPPEYLEEHIVSEKFDIFSLGVVMINILTGELQGHKEISRTPPGNMIDMVQEKWRKMLQDKCSGVSLDLYCQQVKKCTEIALSCLEGDMNKRPNVLEIIKRLNETEKFIEQKKTDPQNKILQRLKELSVSEDSTFRELNILERGGEPSNLKLPILQLITDNFSDGLKVGHGGCGEVYKGILQHGTIAVKKLFNSHTIDDRMFHQEVTSMMRVRHQNIVRLLGYCSHTEEKAVEIEGKTVMAQIRERLLCFEYISNGRLMDHITDELRGLEWNTRYEIIKGICDGLHYLHMEKHIIHMDLKPANILLDHNMIPKITDFGLSRLDDKTHTTCAERLLSLGYCSPEYLHDSKMSAKSDIFSLGVIILEIVTGSKVKPNNISKVLRRWKHRWSKSATHTLLAYKEVDKCLDLAQRCMDHNPINRPNIWDIVSDLKRTDSAEDIREATEYHKLEDMLGIEPLEMRLPIELNKQMSFSIEMTNNTDHYFAFRISTTSLRPYRIQPTKDIIAPQSKFSVKVTLQLERASSSHDRCKDEFTVQSTTVDGGLTIRDISEGIFNEDKGNVVDNVDLTVVLDM